MTRRSRSDRLILTLPPEVIDRLEARGARPDKTHGPFNFTKQLTRTFGLYDSVVLKSDPRETRGLPAEHYELILDLIPEPRRLEAFHIQRLGDYLFENPQFAARARALGVEAAQLAKTVNDLTFAEKLHLVDSAQARHAPPAPRPRTE